MWGDKASLLPSSKLSFVHWEKKKLGKKLANEPDVAISRQLCFTVWHLGPTGSIQGGGEIRSGAFWQDTDGRFQTACREKGDWRAASFILNKGTPGLKSALFYLLRMSGAWWATWSLKKARSTHEGCHSAGLWVLHTPYKLPSYNGKRQWQRQLLAG